MRETVQSVNALLAAIGLFVTAGCRDSETLTFEKGESDGNARPPYVWSIGTLKELWHNGTTRITQDLTIRGYVVANDTSGEFFKELVLEDDTGGIVLSIDDDRLYRHYPLYSLLTVDCQDLALGNEGGTHQLGYYPTGSHVVDRIPTADVSRFLSVAQTSERPAPMTVSIGALTPHHISRYVRIEGVRFIEEGASWCDTDPQTGEPMTTDRTLTDHAGHRLTVRTDRRAIYAGERLPEGEGAICGIIEYFNGTYRLRVIKHEVYFR